MSTNATVEKLDEKAPWENAVYEVLKNHDIRHCAYVPDAGHTGLINKMTNDTGVQSIVLTTEEEGIGYLSGAWLAGERGVLLIQSSGVGNCINTLSLTNSYRFPLLMIITMRGEWAEFNAMQVPMGKATARSLQLMGVNIYHVDRSEEVAKFVEAGADLAFNSDQSVAILISQRVLGKKEWNK